MLFRLAILNGPMSGRRITVPEEPMIIGRDPACDLVLDDEEVAQHHAEVRMQDGALHIRNLGAMTGMLVNQAEVEACILKHGDALELGRTRLLVQAQVQAEVNGTPAAAVPRQPHRRLAAVAVLLALATATALWLRGPPRPDAPTVEDTVADAEPELTLAAAVPEATAEPGTDEPLGSEPETGPAPEIARLGEDLRSIREVVMRLAEAQAAAEDAATPGLADHLLARARAALDDARHEEAEQFLATLLVLAPGRADARAEQARLHEVRGRLDQAAAEWAALADQAEDPEWTRRAEVEMARLAEQQREADAAGAAVRIAGLGHRRFPAHDGFEEMRAVTIRLAPGEPHLRPDPRRVRVEVHFFDREEPSGRLAPSRVVPPILLHPEGEWVPGEPLTVVAVYQVPEGARAAREGGGARTAYHGYRVRVFYRDRLHAEAGRPLSLEGAASETLAAERPAAP